MSSKHGQILKARGVPLSKLARALNVNKGTVSRWAKSRIPAERVVAVEGFTGIPRHELRPDIFMSGEQMEQRA